MKRNYSDLKPTGGELCFNINSTLCSVGAQPSDRKDGAAPCFVRPEGWVPTPWRILLFYICCLFILPFSLVATASGLVIEQDTSWSGQVSISEDVLVRKGATLSVAAGTTIIIAVSESTKTDPEYLSSLTEITVRGELKALGTAEAPIRFIMPDSGQVKGWAGILIDGGRIKLDWVEVEGAESGLSVISGSAVINNSILRNNRYGLSVVRPEADVTLFGSKIIGNDYGVALLNGALINQQKCSIRANKQKDFLQPPVAKFTLCPPDPEQFKKALLTPKNTNSSANSLPNTPAIDEWERWPKYNDVVIPEKKSVYTNESLLGTVVWKDRVVIKGVVRVPAKSKLIIMPGTVVEFSKRDTNGDGFGENGLLVMGMLVAKGTADKPIVFRSAEEKKAMGDWDSINIYSSDGVQNLIEYCRIENAYRALHFHFSNVAVKHSVLHDNYRALQFQESMIDVSYNDIYGNKSALRARDSEVILSHNRIYDNYTGPNIFRITGQITNNTIAGNYLDGLRVREGALQVSENYLTGNRYGLTVAYANYGKFSANVISANLETGITLKGTDSIQVVDNFVQGNGGNGISLLETQAVIKGNFLSDNGERGIGVISFSGVISGNNFINNQLYAVGLDGLGDVLAPANWWGGAVLDEVINDRHDDPDKGLLDYGQPLSDPLPFTWPLDKIITDTVWYGETQVPRKVIVYKGTTLTITPQSTVAVIKDRGIWSNGTIRAVGEPGKRILFTGIQKDKEAHWHQVMVEGGQGIFVNCDFEYAKIALHSHYSGMLVQNSTFQHNEIGYRFKGGPVKIIKSEFVDNGYGIVPNLGIGKIVDSEFTRNEVGIIVREEKNGALAINRNNIYDNSKHNMRMGAFNPGEDVDARHNWWDGDPQTSIYDARSEPGIGMIKFEPVAARKFTVH